MKITATCKCGARLEVDGEESMDAKGVHRDWQDRHFDCLRPPVVRDTYPSVQPLSAEKERDPAYRVAAQQDLERDIKNVMYGGQTKTTRNEDSPPCPNHGKIFQCNCFPTSIRHEDGSECDCPA